MLLTTRLLSSLAFLSGDLPGEVGFSWVGAESRSPSLLSDTGSGNEKQPLAEVLLVAPKQPLSSPLPLQKKPPSQTIQLGEVCLLILDRNEFHVEQRSANQAWPPVFVNELLLEYSHTHSFTNYLWLLSS